MNNDRAVCPWVQNGSAIARSARDREAPVRGASSLDDSWCSRERERRSSTRRVRDGDGACLRGSVSRSDAAPSGTASIGAQRRYWR